MNNKWIQLAMVATMTAGLAVAQGPRFGRSGPRSPGAEGSRQERGNPEGARQRFFDFQATYLGLTETQKQDAKAIFDAAAEASSALREQSRQAREALRNAVKENKSDAEIDRLAATWGNLVAQSTAIQTKASTKFYALLTPEQREKLDKLPGRGGPGGRFGPPPFMAPQL